jgi:hypothetical protein
MACLELVRKLLSLLGKVANVRHITINLWISVVWCSQCVPWIWLFLVQNQEQRIHYIIAGLGNQLTHLYIHIHILYIIYIIYILLNIICTIHSDSMFEQTWQEQGNFRGIPWNSPDLVRYRWPNNGSQVVVRMQMEATTWWRARYFQ